MSEKSSLGPGDVPHPNLSLRERAELDAAASIILSPRSHEVNRLIDSYIDGSVRLFGDEQSRTGRSGAMRTEIDLPDGRMAVVHKNVMPVIGLAAPRFDFIAVSTGDGLIGRIDLGVNPDSSPYNPSYIATINGRKLYDEANGSELDLALADDLLDFAVSMEKRMRSGYSIEGYAASLGELVTEMRPGFSVDALSPTLFDPAPSGS